MNATKGRTIRTYTTHEDRSRIQEVLDAYLAEVDKWYTVDDMRHYIIDFYPSFGQWVHKKLSNLIDQRLWGMVIEGEAIRYRRQGGRYVYSNPDSTCPYHADKLAPDVRAQKLAPQATDNTDPAGEDVAATDDITVEAEASHAPAAEEPVNYDTVLQPSLQFAAVNTPTPLPYTLSWTDQLEMAVAVLTTTVHTLTPQQQRAVDAILAAGTLLDTLHTEA